MAPYKSGRPTNRAFKKGRNSTSSQLDDNDAETVENAATSARRLAESQREEISNSTGMRKLKYRARLWFFSLGWGTQNVLEMTLAIGTLLAATAVGGLVFSALETDTARAVFPATCPKADTTAAHLPTLRRRLTGMKINGEYAQAMTTMKAQLFNATGSDTSYWNNLVGTVGALDPSMLPKNMDTWGFTSYHSFLFSFTLITTIGYGEITPKTVGGRLWLCAYAIFCIPIAGMALAKIATIFMDLAEWIIVGSSPTLRKVFHFSDASGRGLMGFNAAKALMKDIHGGTIDELAFRHAFEVASNLRAEPELTYWEFIRLFLMVDNPEMQRKRRYYRLYLSAAFVVLWLLVGMFSFNKFEQWGYVPSFYFSFVTLSTIGLGDYYPSTKPGADFHFFYCVFGLGLVAVFLSATGDILLEGEAADMEKLQEKYIKEWEERNKDFVTDFERADVEQTAIGEMVRAMNADGQVTSPKSSHARRSSAGFVGGGGGEDVVQEVFSKALMLDPHSREVLLHALLEKYKVLPQFIVDKAAASGQLPAGRAGPKGAAGARGAADDGLRPAPYSLVAPGVKPAHNKYGPAFPTERTEVDDAHESSDVPDFLPTYTQIYEDTPILLSGVGRHGAPVPPVAGGRMPPDSDALYGGGGDLPSVGAYNNARNNGPWAPSDVPQRPRSQVGPGVRRFDGVEPLEAAAFAVLGNDRVPTSVAGVPPHGAGRSNRRHNADANDNRL